MKLKFTKMHGAGNDFVVIDAIHQQIDFTPAQWRHLADRRFGVGADQILVVEPSTTPGVDFRYRIFNGFSGDEVEHCGNGARCFVHFVRDKGLSSKSRLRVDDVRAAPVAVLGPAIEGHPRFPRRVNAGFMQLMARHEIALRVYERGAGETLACGTGACAAVVAGIRLGWLDRRVEVHTRGGDLLIEWLHDDAHVLMTGPAQTVFEGEIEL